MSKIIKTNLVYICVLISIWLSGLIYEEILDGVMIILIQGIAYLLIGNLLAYFHRKRQLVSKKWINYLLWIIEGILLFIIGSLYISHKSTMCLCLIEAFGVPIEFLEYGILMIFIIHYLWLYFQRYEKYGRILVVSIFILIIILDNLEFITTIYKETFINTRFPSEQNEGYLKNSKGAYYEIGMDTTYVLTGADLDSFVGLNSAYAKDKNRVYFMDQIIPADAESFKIIEDSFHDKKSFERFTGKWTELFYLKDGYAKDKDKVFYFGEIIQDANPKTFTPVGSGFAKDDKNIYNQGKKISK